MQVTRVNAHLDDSGPAISSLHEHQVRLVDEFFQQGQQQHQQSLFYQNQDRQGALIHYEIMEIMAYLNYKAIQQAPQIGSGLGAHCICCKFRHPLPNGLQDWQCENCHHVNHINLSWEP